MDMLLTLVSVVFAYSSPVFLKLILDSIGDLESSSSTPPRTKAYIYAFLMFFFTLFKAEADLQHLWYGRRAASRMRSQLMAAIYDKALKRRDLSGTVVQTEKPAPPQDKPKAKKGS